MLWGNLGMQGQNQCVEGQLSANRVSSKQGDKPFCFQTDDLVLPWYRRKFALDPLWGWDSHAQLGLCTMPTQSQGTRSQPLQSLNCRGPSTDFQLYGVLHAPLGLGDHSSNPRMLDLSPQTWQVSQSWLWLGHG